MNLITSTIVAALTLGIASGATEVGKEVIVDAYNALKAAIVRKCGTESKVFQALGGLEKEPDFEPNQSALAGRIEQAELTEDQELLQLTKALLVALENTPEGEKAIIKYKIDAQNIGVVGDSTSIKGGINFKDT